MATIEEISAWQRGLLTNDTTGTIADILTRLTRLEAASNVAYSASSTSNQTGISAITDITFAGATWTAVAGRLYRVTLSVAPLQVTSTGNQVLSINAGGSGSGTSLGVGGSSGVLAAAYGSGVVVAYLTGSGSTTVHARATTSAGTLTIDNATETGWFVVEDVGPA
jgi:hypothetical protein